jgi:glycosyltransferase involved in cell wall biosynthesis
MLVPHEPDADPRIGWVTDLCAAIAETVVLGTTWSAEPSTRERRGDAFVERIYIPDAMSNAAQAAGLVGAALQKLVALADRARGSGRHVDGKTGASRLALSILRFSAFWLGHAMVISALYRRARDEPAPELIVCHDLPGLIVGARLKRRWDVPLLYDTHEYWPEADLRFEPWEASLLTRVERRLIRRADQVVTVSPPLAAHLERLYGIETVLSVPNAVPAEPTRRSNGTSRGGKIRFLLQGQLAVGRGLELLLDAWSELGTDDAVLQLRYVPNDYARAVESRYATLFESGRVVKLAPVGETELVEAAAAADVGVVPYTGPNLNHLYACPNKVSQYMRAGLALLVSSEMLYVGDLLDQFGCGVTYDPRRSETLRAAIESIVQDPEHLARMKHASLSASETAFNWEVVSRPYGEAIRRLLGLRDDVPEVA